MKEKQEAPEFRPWEEFTQYAYMLLPIHIYAFSDLFNFMEPRFSQLKLSGDVNEFVDMAKSKCAEAIGSKPEELRIVSLSFHFLDRAGMVYQSAVSSPGFDLKNLSASISDEMDVGKCWKILTESMGALLEILNNRGYNHRESTFFKDESASKGFAGIKLILVGEILDEISDDEQKRLVEDVQVRLKERLDDAFDGQFEDDELARMISRTIDIIVDRRVEDEDP